MKNRPRWSAGFACPPYRDRDTGRPCPVTSPYVVWAAEESRLADHWQIIGFGQTIGEDDDRRTCARCRYGDRTRCANVAPLPVDMLHHCAQFEARPADAPDAVAAGHDEPSLLALVRHKRAQWVQFLNDVRAADAVRGVPRRASSEKG